MNEYGTGPDKMADVLNAAQGYEAHPPERGRADSSLQHLLGARRGTRKGLQRPGPHHERRT